jgi:L-ribulokinase
LCIRRGDVASVAAGVHPDLESAQEAMSSGFNAVYQPREAQSAVYQQLYQKYLEAGAYIENDFLQKAYLQLT